MKIPSTSSVYAEIGQQSQRLGFDRKNWGDVTEKLMESLSVSSKSPAPISTSGLVDMFKLQVQMNKLHLRVELCSKLAESASATVKKLQQAQ